ncbi:MAG: alpha/beta fold hydrolase [Mycobacterium sp.]|nr:alpha/beta fold hydrolase [Mycobacterium sp.]
MSYRETTFNSGGTSCSAWHFTGDGPGPRPVVVMAHGFAGTKDSGLAPFAERFADAGFDVLAFDYRGFGASEGQPRQSISITRQLQDYDAAIAAAKRLPDVDPDRIVLWGVSLSGGHVIRVAADRGDVKAVIALTPLTDAVATARGVLKQYSLAAAGRATVDGVASRVVVARGGTPVMMPVVGRPGEPGGLTLDGAYENYHAIAGPTWRNEVDSAVGQELMKIKTKPYAKRLKPSLLVQIADFDSYVPADAVARTAEYGRGWVHHYPCDHFDVWPGLEWFDRAVGDQVSFLRKVFG